MAQEFTKHYSEWLDWVVGAPTDDDNDMASLDCRGFSEVLLKFAISGTGVPDGKLDIQWSFDGTAWHAYNFSNAEHHKVIEIDPGGDFTLTEAIGRVDLITLAVDSVFMLSIRSPPPYMRGTWVSDSAGSATGLSASALGRIAGQ